jgi:hypothetical protein
MDKIIIMSFFYSGSASRHGVGAAARMQTMTMHYMMTDGTFRFISLAVTRIRLQFGENQQVPVLSFSIWLRMEEIRSLLSSRPSFQALSSWVHNTGLMTAYPR